MTWLLCAAGHRPDTMPHMPAGASTYRTQTRMTAQDIVETVEKPEFCVSELAELRQRIVAGDSWLDEPSFHEWSSGTGALYLRCETYPQCTRLSTALYKKGIEHRGGYTGIERTKTVLRTATAEQLLEALEHEQEHPVERWAATDDILKHADTEQLVGPVICQLQWGPHLAWAADTTTNSPETRRHRHVIDHIKQCLLGSDENAWAAFLQICENGYRVGETSQLVNTVTQNETQQEAPANTTTSQIPDSSNRRRRQPRRRRENPMLARIRAATTRH